jgi:hypothetical protein
MYQFVLKENVLTDNILNVPSKGKVFKGGFIAIIQEYVFANEWSDKPLPNKNFRSVNSLNKYLEKYYPDFECDFFGTSLEG